MDSAKEVCVGMKEQFSYNVILVESRNIFVLSTIDGICRKSNYVVRECEANAELWFVFGKINFVYVDGCGVKLCICNQ